MNACPSIVANNCWIAVSFNHKVLDHFYFTWPDWVVAEKTVYATWISITVAIKSIKCRLIIRLNTDNNRHESCIWELTRNGYDKWCGTYTPALTSYICEPLVYIIEAGRGAELSNITVCTPMVFLFAVPQLLPWNRLWHLLMISNDVNFCLHQKHIMWER